MRGDLASVLCELGRWSEARVIFEQMSARDTTDVGLRFLATIAAVHQGDRAAAATFDRWLSDAEMRGPLATQWLTSGGPAPDPNYLRAHLALVMGDTAAALSHLRALPAKFGAAYLYGMYRESDWLRMRNDPRVRALLRPPE
jgi:pentatricopeptide repeat protein